MRRRILNTMKRLEIVMERDRAPMVCSILGEHATGYTVLPHVTGFGHHGHRDDTVLLVTVVTRDHVDPILDEVVPLLDRRLGVVLITDVQVVRGEYFVPDLNERATPRG